MKPTILISSIVALTLGALPTLAADYAQLKSDAEKLYADGSYGKAHEIYSQADTNKLSAADVRWVTFRIADTIWRSQAGTQTSDPTKFEKAQQQLNVLIRDIQRVEDRDRVWVEVQESLGDFHWVRRNARNWGAAWQYYNNALDWWAGAPDIEQARARYLKIARNIASPPEREEHYYYGYYGNILPMPILENLLKITRDKNDLAHAHYLIAMTIRNQGGDWEQRARVAEEFEAALAAGKGTDWYDDALYNYAEWMNSYGQIIQLEAGNWRQEPDYIKALELFRRLVSESKKGETRYFDQAQAQIQNITKPNVSVSVGNIFLPGSEVQYYLNWRNLKNVELAIYKVDLTRDVKLSGDDNTGNWLQRIALGELVTSWSKDTKDKGDYKPGQEQMRLDKKLPAGAYVIEAKGGGERARELVLVTDATLVLKTSGKQALAFFCNALDGSPVANARLKLWERYHDGNWHWRDAEAKTDKDGLAVFELSKATSRDQLFVAAAIEDRQAFSFGYSNYHNPGHQPWRIYAFTDRPAYRPKEKVEWKFIARQYNGSVYSTPADQTIEFQIDDPRGQKVHEGKSKLNGFGSAWGSLELTEAMPLGEYHVQFWDEGRRNGIGNATLFRLEEYKLPEFKVAIETPEEDGRKKAFRLGDKVEVNIQADYYFGGAVANANVEVIVYQNPYYQSWHRPYDYPWFYQDMMPNWQSRRHYGGQGQIIKRETLKTDATGKASLTFDTPKNAGQDFEFRVEARVTDASRREIVGSDTVRVTRQRYYVYPRAEHNLYKPQDKVTVEFKALDANEQPVQTEGTVKVTRDYWFEIWLDPNGKEIKGDELRTMRDKATIFPPTPKSPGDKGWQLKFRGYEHDDILTRTVKTDTNGVAELSFTPERDGYYRVAWSSDDTPHPALSPKGRGDEAARKSATRDRSISSPPGGEEKGEGYRSPKGGPPIKSDTTVWVCTTASSELGYRHGGVEIIVDKDTFRAGQKAPVLLSVPTNDRYVLFSVEGEDLYSYQLVHVTGTAKLVELPIEEKHVPNIFLSAAMVSDRQFFVDTKQIVVPPVKNFLTVDVQPDRPQYQPREDGTLTVTARDDEGKPVAAEIAFGLVDESVFYIQQDYAGDPRQFYFGTKRPQTIQTQSTFNQKQYLKLVEGAEKQLFDDRELRRRDEGDRLNVNAALEKGEASYALRGGGMAQRAAKSALGAAVSESVAMDAVMPASAPMQSREEMAKEKKADGFFGGAGGKLGGGEEPAVVVRSDFRSTILWQPDLVTDKDGKATVKIKYPDSLTSWKATARVLTAGNQFGIANTTTRTKQPLIVRLQAPRFFVVGDTVTISAVINNNTDSEIKVKTELDLGDTNSPLTLVLSPGGERKSGGRSSEQDSHSVSSPLGGEGRVRGVVVPANSETRVDWTTTVSKDGETKLKVTARADKYSDAMEKTYPVFEHGIEKFVSKSGKVRSDDVTVRLDIPKERKPESTTLTVQVAPSMAVTMLDALPYLADYPYGCVEQTMSRFLPAAITAKTLKDLGLHPEDVMDKVFGGIEQAHVAKTQPKGKKDLAKLDVMVKAGLDRLYDMQHSDGGWGWWKGGDSDHFMTAYVVWGLTLSRDAGLNPKGESLERGVNYLDKEIVEEETNHDQQAWMLHALSAYHASAKLKTVRPFQAKAFENLWKNKDKLNAYTRALLALSAHHYGYADKAKTLIENLENGVKRDDKPDTSIVMEGDQKSHEAVIGTAHWGEDGFYWRWSEGGVEATAFVLKALLTIDPQNKLIEPVTNWLVKNRRGAQWSNTRDTAIVVLTLNDYLRVSKELSHEVEYELLVNGNSIVKKKLTTEDALSAPSRFAIDRKFIKDGANEIRIKRKGSKGAIYFAAEAQFFSLEEPIKPAGNEIFVRRHYHKIVGRPTLLKGYVYDKQPLSDNETVKSGERVECVITIEGKNNYEYLVFEDLKPAGFEAVELRSGDNVYAKEIKSGGIDAKLKHSQEASDYTGRNRWVYQELRDRKVALFLDKLPEGVWEIRYELRAEVPGKFHALPVLGHAMYVPEIRCNGSEVRIEVKD